MSEQEPGQPQEPIHVSAILAVALEQFAAIAWQKMGLQHDALTGTLSRDMAQARVAVDVASELAKHLESFLDDDDKRQVQNLVRDLRVNFVERAKETNA